MARGGVPDEGVYDPRVMPEDLPRKLTPEMRGPSPVGEALERLGDSASIKYQRDAATWAGDQVAALRVKAVQNLETMKRNAPSGDPGNFTENYLTQFDKDAAPLTDAASNNPYARAMVHKGVQELRDTLATHTMGWEAAQRVAYRTDSIDQNITSQLPLVEAHPELATSVGSTLMDQVNASGADPAKRLEMGRAMHAQISMAAATGLARQNPAGTLTALNDPDNAPDALRGLTNEQREAVRARASQELVKNKAAAITQVYSGAGTTAGVHALAGVDQDASIPDELKPQVRAQVNNEVNQLRDQRREENAQEIAGLESRITTGDAGGPQDRATARALFEKGAYSTTQYASTLAGIARSEESSVDDQANLHAAADAYRSGSPLDPQDRDVKKGVQQLFTAMTRGTDPGSQEYVNRAVDITAKVGVVPEPVVSWARTSLVGGDAKSAAAAADLISRLQETNPRAVPFALDPKTKAIAATINNAVRAGADAQSAVDVGRRAAQIPEAEIKALDTRWKTAKLDQSQPSQLRTLMQSADPEFKGGWFTADPKIPTEMQSQFDQLTRTYYHDTGGNVQLARQLAARDVGHVWGVSRVNGDPQVMAYAPERMFPGLTPDVVRSDIATAAAGSADLKDLDAGKIRLVEDPERTARTSGAQWNLEAPDKNGLIHTLHGADGKPLIYQLPVTKQDYEAVRSKARGEALQSLEKDRAARKDMHAFDDVVPGL